MRRDVGGSCCRCGTGRSAKAKQGRRWERWYFQIEQVNPPPAPPPTPPASAPANLSKCRDVRENYFFRSGNSLYELLEIPKDSTPEDIKKKYRRLALKYDTIYLELNPVEIPLLQVSPGQKSWQCGGWGDVQEDQQCQCYPEVRLELTMTMKWNLCGLLAKTNWQMFSVMRRKDNCTTNMGALVFILQTRWVGDCWLIANSESSVLATWLAFTDAYLPTLRTAWLLCFIWIGWRRPGGHLVLCPVQVVQGDKESTQAMFSTFPIMLQGLFCLCGLLTGCYFMCCLCCCCW